MITIIKLVNTSITSVTFFFFGGENFEELSNFLWHMKLSARAATVPALNLVTFALFSLYIHLFYI